MKFLSNALIIAFCAGLSGESLAATKSDKRSKMTEAQKKELRIRAREYCRKKYAKGGAFVESVDIQSDGTPICWIRG
jgi:hypothetical protein